jgi:hypothetical protein
MILANAIKIRFADFETHFWLIVNIYAVHDNYAVLEIMK